MSLEVSIVCLNCGAEYGYESFPWRCVNCESPLSVSFNSMGSGFKRSVLTHRVKNMWRYKELIPVKSSTPVSLSEGFTPIASKRIDGVKVYFKLEYLSPSGSFKDRGSSVTITQALDSKAKRVTEDSSGNAGASIALYSSVAGLRARIYVPRDAPEGKKELIRLLGAEVVEAESREDAFRRAVEELKSGDRYVGHLWNPFFVEGVKTMAYESIEQLGWRVTDYLIAPMSGGSILLGFQRGLSEFDELGYVDGECTLIGVQAAGYSPIHDRIHGEPEVRVRSVLADALRVLNPPRLKELIELFRGRNRVVVVGDEEIKVALKELIRMGFLVEPSSATAYSAFKKLVDEGFIKAGEEALIPLTGSGLKMIDKLTLILSD